MAPDIHADLTLFQILRHYPETHKIFVSNGLGALVSEQSMRVLAPFLTLGTALRSRFIDTDKFIVLLKAATQKQVPIEAPGLESMAAQKDLTFLGLMPCGLKMPFSRAFTEFMTGLDPADTTGVHYAVEGNLNQEISYYAYVDTIEKAEELPDIVVSADFNSFYGHRFYDRFVASGEFGGYGSFTPAKNYETAGICDPRQEYTILCVNPLVVVANLDQTGDRPLPETLSDLLDPVWKKDLILRGGNSFYCHGVLLPIHQEFGAEGLRALAANVRQGLHPAQMVDQIDKNTPGALYIMPEFFVRRIRHQERIKVIWPKDGALASPVTLQVKPSRKKELEPVLNFLTGIPLATTLAKAGFPVPHAEISAKVQDRPLKWLGWEYLRRHDLSALNMEIDEIFMPLAP